MRTYLTSLAFAVIFGLVSCGGGNDMAASVATAVSAAASATATPQVWAIAKLFKEVGMALLQ